MTDLELAWDSYRAARVALLATLNLRQSFRDPLSEFAEVLVAGLLNGRLAANRVQKDWDIESPVGLVQVKYLANPSQGPWPNWHPIAIPGDIDWYALVIYLDLSPVAVYVFPNTCLSPFCEALGKRHAQQDRTLQFTKTNHRDISANPDKFEAMGMKVFLLSGERRPC